LETKEEVRFEAKDQQAAINAAQRNLDQVIAEALLGYASQMACAEYPKFVSTDASVSFCSKRIKVST
jgi:hypothetical protein